MRERILTASAVLALAALLSGCSDWGGRMDHGKVFAADRTEIAVAPGQTFSLHWKLSVVPGNDWKPAAPAADPTVVTLLGPDLIHGDSNSAGDGGQLYLVFRAGSHPGSTELVVQNCWDCTGALKQIYGARHSYRVTVR